MEGVAFDRLSFQKTSSSSHWRTSISLDLYFYSAYFKCIPFTATLDSFSEVRLRFNSEGLVSQTCVVPRPEIIIPSELLQSCSWKLLLLFWLTLRLISYSRKFQVETVEIVAWDIFADTFEFRQERKFRFVVIGIESRSMKKCRQLLLQTIWSFSGHTKNEMSRIL